MRFSAHSSDRKVVATAAVTAGVIGALSAIAFTVDAGGSAPEQETAGIAHLADATSVTTSTTAQRTPATTPPPAPAPEDHSEPGPLGVPGIAMRAYQQAAERLATEQPQCALPWTLLAGIGQVESQHGAGRIRTDGTTVERITGPRLDGSIPGTATITDTDGGRLDGDKDFDRAVGPVQFLPSTWALVGRDANGDGVADPNNIFDSALSTGSLLCSAGGSMADPGARTRAILGYNNSMAYVANVNAWAHGYETGEYPRPEDLPPIHPAPEAKIPERCPDGWGGKPTAAPETAAPGEPAPPVPGCTAPETNPAPAPAPAPALCEPRPRSPDSDERPAPHRAGTGARSAPTIRRGGRRTGR